MPKRPVVLAVQQGNASQQPENPEVTALAKALIEAKTPDQRTQLLAQHKDLVGMELARKLLGACVDLYGASEYGQELDLLPITLNIARKAGNTSLVADILNLTGTTQYLSGDTTQALASLEESRNLRNPATESKSIAGTLNNIGAVYIARQQYDKALEAFRQSLQIKEAIGDQLGIAKTYTNIGQVYDDEGDYRRGLENYAKSLELKKSLTGIPEKRLQTGNTLLNIGANYKDQNDYELGESFARRALQKYQEAQDDAGQVDALNNIGEIQIVRHDLEGASTTFATATKLAESTQYAAGLMRVYGNLALLCREKKQYTEARKMYQSSSNVAEKAEDRLALAQIRTAIVELYNDQKQFVEAHQLAVQAIQLAREIDSPETLWLALSADGTALLGQKHLEDAQKAFDEAIHVIEKLRSQFSGEPEQQQQFFAGRVDPYHQMVALLAGQGLTEKAFIYTERARARALLDTLQKGRSAIPVKVDAQTQNRETQLREQLVEFNSKIRKELQKLSPDTKLIARLQAQREQTRRDFEDARARLFTADPDLKVRSGEYLPITREQCAELLPNAHTALLEFLATADQTYLFVLTRAAHGDTPDIHLFRCKLSGPELTAAVEDFRDRLSKGIDFKPQSRELYNALLRPAQALLEGKQTLILAPDGPLWELPFPALMPAQKQFLVENVALSYTPSCSVLREMNRWRQRRKGVAASCPLVAFGNPFPGDRPTSPQPALADEDIAPLPYMEKQVRRLKDLYGPTSRTYIGAQATEESAKKEAQDCRFLDFATHATLDDKTPMYSYLSFARDPHGTEDGRLETWEVMQLPLKAELVALSACQTARGRVSAGEGMIGLAWAFFVAGCPTTVASQWRVRDDSASELMVAFFRQVKAGVPKNEALRQAALTLLHSPNPDYHHPMHWADFMLLGASR